MSMSFPPALPLTTSLSIPSVSAVSVTDQAVPPALILQGTVLNNSPYQLKSVKLVFMLYDSANQIVGVSQREEFTVRANERRAYRQVWPQPPTLTGPVRVAVKAETNVLNPDNLMIEGGNNTPGSSNLGRPVDEH